MAFLSFLGTGSRLGSKRASAPFLPLAAGGVLQKDRKAQSSQSSVNCKRALSSAFTIIELLIVVVVIAILAAVTIIAYNGITNRAKGSAVASSVTQAGKKLEVFKTTTGAGFYPADITAANTAIGSGLTLTKYLTNTPTNPTNYCATITDTSTSPATSYSVSSTSSTTMPGECVENLVVNPIIGQVGLWGAYAGAGGIPVGTLQASVGGGLASYGIDSAFRLTLGGVPTGSWYHLSYVDVASLSVVPGQTYNLTALVRSSVSADVGAMLQWYNGVTVVNTIESRSTVAANTWAVRTLTATVPAGVNNMRVGVNAGGGASGVWLEGTGFVLTLGASKYPAALYGGSPGWFWKGAPHSSTSIGPAVVQ